MKRTRRTQIDLHEKGPRVIELVRAGKKSPEISRALAEEGVKISPSAVARWIKERSEEADVMAEKVFTEHVERELPKDLQALEEMERKLLEWSREEPGARAARISTWPKVRNSLDAFADRILSARQAGDEDQAKLIEGIVQMVTRWVVRDMKDKQDRRADMKLAAYMIEIKLARHGVLQSSGARVVMKFSNEAPKSEAQKADVKKPLKLHLSGGKPGV